MVGRPSGAGFSEKAKAVTPRSAMPHHLLGGERRIPQRDQHQRDVPTGGGAAPLLDEPVVVDLEALEAELAVARLHEQLAAEPGDRGEAERGEDAGPVHVLEAGHRVVATRAASRSTGSGSGLNSSLVLPATALRPELG